MAKYEREENEAFEEEVRRIARLLWSTDQSGGSATEDGRERDGIFENRDMIHIVEATTSRRKDKIQGDAHKTALLVKSKRKSQQKGVAGWLITQGEPTPDQKSAAYLHNNELSILSFDQFRSRVFNGTDYLNCRNSYPFGSAQDLRHGNTHIADDAFIPIDMISLSDKTIYTIKSAPIWIKKNGGNRAVITGEYGTGKSMTLRELFILYRKQYFTNKSHICPIHLNLRDHIGQTDPSEALHRHAKKIGFANPIDLVRFWRLGSSALILDGFDELSSLSFGTKISEIRDHRQRSMELIRNFFKESTSSTPIYVAGRSNYFDSISELKRALSIQDHNTILSMNEFTEDQIANYLEKLGVTNTLPDWIPTRPLLLGYLASRVQFADPTLTDIKSKGDCWDYLLDKICEREKDQDPRLVADTIRKIMERLATRARASTDGLGRFDMRTLSDTFRDIVGVSPDEAALNLISRLPGLNPMELEDHTRTFVDPALTDAARAGDVVQFCQMPYSSDELVKLFEESSNAAGDICHDVVRARLEKMKLAPNGILNAAQVASEKDNCGDLAIDIWASLLNRNQEIKITKTLIIKEASATDLHLSDQHDSDKIEFWECLFDRIWADSWLVNSKQPKFVNCSINEVIGFIPDKDKAAHFAESDVDRYVTEKASNNLILASSLPVSVRVLISILRKLYAQSGSGRLEKALRAGLDTDSSRHVDGVLRAITQEGFARLSGRPGKEIWLPDRSKLREVHRILNDPMGSKSQLVRKLLQ
ncbi:NACHT domain-containing protein [Maricaulis sp.]|uniref:NACHT domain-containing protein n=1 Tax=Maricaulis sp. TaxID=1486257 RepID=UPI003A8CA959